MLVVEIMLMVVVAVEEVSSGDLQNPSLVLVDLILFLLVLEVLVNQLITVVFLMVPMVEIQQ